MKKYFLFIILLVLLLIPLGDLFHFGLPVTHDGQDHVARIANFYQNLQQGIIIPRWAPNLDWGYGHPILMFLYPLPSYFASLFHVVGFSLVDSVKIVFGLSFVLSGLTMFLWLRAFLSEKAAVIGALLYTFAPYRFVDFYVRGAIGEHVAFVFPPLVLYFLYKLSKKQTYLSMVGGALSFAGLILAHNAISLMFLPVIFAYIFYHVWQSKKRKSLLLASCFLLLFGFALSAFFWLPAFAEGKYTLRDIVTGKEALTRFVPWQTFIYGPWSYGITGQFTVQFGIIQWIVLILSLPLVVILFRKKNPLWLFVAFCLAAFLFIAYFMTAGARPLWEMITIIQKFQFPWRFLSLSVFFAAVLGAVVIDQVIKLKVIKSSSIQWMIVIVLIGAILFFNKDYWHAKDYLYKPVVFYTGIYDSPTDTGESAPRWSVRFMLRRPAASLEVVDGDAIIVEKQRLVTNHVYEVTATKKTRLRENTLYFPGWKVFVDGKEVPIEFQDRVRANQGLMTFYVDKGKHTVQVHFGETKLRLFADFISIGSFFVLGIFGIIYSRMKKKYD